MAVTEPGAQDSEAICPKCKGKLTSPDQPCPWCAIVAAPTIPVVHGRKRISGREWAMGIAGVLMLGATSFIPAPKEAISPQALLHQFITTTIALLGGALLVLAIIKHAKRNE